MAEGDVFRAALSGHISTEPWMSTFGLVEQASGGGGTNPLEDAANAVVGALGSDPIADFSNELSIQEIVIQDVQPGTASAFRLPVAFVGGAEGASLPPQDAAVISWTTALRGPMNRGRMYMPGMPSSAQDVGYWKPEALASVGVFAHYFLDYFVADTGPYGLVVLSMVPGSSPRVLREAVPIVGFHVPFAVRSQRRRGIGVRIHRRGTP